MEILFKYFMGYALHFPHKNELIWEAYYGMQSTQMRLNIQHKQISEMEKYVLLVFIYILSLVTVIMNIQPVLTCKV